MNFVIYSISEKRTKKIKGGGFLFTKVDPRELNKRAHRQFREDILFTQGYDIKHFRLDLVGSFKGLKKLRRGYIKSVIKQR